MITERMQQFAGVNINIINEAQASLTPDDAQKTKIPWTVQEFGAFHQQWKPSGIVNKHKIIDITDEGLIYRIGKNISVEKWKYIDAESITYITKNRTKIVQVAFMYKKRDPIVYVVGRKP